MKTTRRKVNVVKIIDAIIELVGYIGIVSVVGLLLFAPVFNPTTYYTMLLVAVIAASAPLFYLAVWAEWVSNNKIHNERNHEDESVQREVIM